MRVGSGHVPVHEGHVPVQFHRTTIYQETSREKTFTNFEVLWLFVKVFCVRFGGMASFGGTSKQFAKVFSAKIYFPPIRISFLPQKFLTIQLR